MADQVLYLVDERRLSVDDVVARGFERKTVEAIVGRMEMTAFKRRMPRMLPVERGATPA